MALLLEEGRQVQSERWGHWESLLCALLLLLVVPLALSPPWARRVVSPRLYA